MNLIQTYQYSVASSARVDEQRVDVLIIGTGAAAACALKSILESKHVRVAVITKGQTSNAHSINANGMNGALPSRNIAWEAHASDTIIGGDYLADQDAVEAMCQDAEGIVERLREWGVKYRDELVGKFGYKPYHLPDITGKQIVDTAFSMADLADRINVFEKSRVLQLLTTFSDNGKKRCTGALVVCETSGTLTKIHANAVILTTGGYTQLYRPSTTSQDCTGDGVALAYAAGAQIMDMEMVQYHPTTLPQDGTLISESCRSAGAILVNAKGERFMERYAPDTMERSTRDVISKAIWSEGRAGRTFDDGTVALDFSVLANLDHAFATVNTPLAHIIEKATTVAGVDIRHQSLKVRPAVHYSMGGIKTDVWGRSTLDGLFAAGECACVSVHGANRLGGNSLLDTVVFGWRAGKAAIEFHANAPRNSWDNHEDTPGGVRPAQVAQSNTQQIEKIRLELGITMDKHVGIVRSAESLERARMHVRELEMRVQDIAGLSKYDPKAMDVVVMLTLAPIVIESALARKESRGAHFRSDFPMRSPDRVPRHIVATLVDGERRITETVVRSTKWGFGS